MRQKRGVLKTQMQLKEGQASQPPADSLTHCRDLRELMLVDLTAAEAYELVEWWSYAKPVGPSIKIEIAAQRDVEFSLTTTGTEPSEALPCECPKSEIFVG
jgi:hypothetical protein